jgi:hypothetical protein
MEAQEAETMSRYSSGRKLGHYCGVSGRLGWRACWRMLIAGEFWTALLVLAKIQLLSLKVMQALITYFGHILEQCAKI